MNAFARRLHGRSYINLLLNWRWMVLLIAIPVSLVIEILEGRSFDLHILDEVVLDGLVLPLTTWAVLTFAARKLAKQFEREQLLEVRQQFLQRLAEQRDYGQLAQFVVRYPATLLPVAHASLFVCEGDERQLHLVTAQDYDHSQQRGPLALAAGREHRFILMANDRQLGLLLVRCQPGEQIDADRLALLTSLVPELGRALSRALAESEQKEQLYRAARAYERRRLTQELHDSLAQQVFYLHLGLDQLSGDTTLNASTAVRRKLSSMRDVAAEVYEQIRNNLSILRAWEQVNLTEAISELARLTAHNAELTIDINVRGEPEWLSPHTCEHVYGVVREALHNVVKHARAGHVQLDLTWSADSLRISLSDNGVGFEPAVAPGADHYGLILMREAVDAFEGTISIDSSPGAGTRLVIGVPLRRAGSYLLQKQPKAYDLHPVLDAAQ